MDVDYGVDRAQHILARVLLIVDKGLGQHAFIAVGTVDGDLGLVLHTVQPVDAGLDGSPLQQVGEPAGRDPLHLCGVVLVAFASCRAATSPSADWRSGSLAIRFVSPRRLIVSFRLSWILTL